MPEIEAVKVRTLGLHHPVVGLILHLLNLRTMIKHLTPGSKLS